VTRVDYLDDPDAPPANSLVPSVTAILTNDAGQLLLVHKTDNDLWAFPGGATDPGESVTDAVVREVREKAGVEVEVARLGGLYSNPWHVMAYDDGEVRQQFSLCFTTRMLGGDHGPLVTRARFASYRTPGGMKVNLFPGNRLP